MKFKAKNIKNLQQQEASTAIKQLRDNIAVVEAFLAGSEIEKNHRGNQKEQWVDAELEDNEWNFTDYAYRIKERTVNIVPWSLGELFSIAGTDYIYVSRNNFMEYRITGMSSSPDFIGIHVESLDKDPERGLEPTYSLESFCRNFDYVDKEGNRKHCGFLMEEKKEIRHKFGNVNTDNNMG